MAVTERRCAGQSPAGPVGLQGTSDGVLQLDRDTGRWLVAGGSAGGADRTELRCYCRHPKVGGPKLGVPLKAKGRTELLRYGLSSQKTSFC